ncbi:unnamed protein product [Dibothriocephalus latus]|uniref:Uncharacterized protein n=1 Tax=Dibothriocephalus latus TaxID=60516 RepID=A0A3P6PM11_DIBLA|nr:unnamed protein product [Dibothriocephalus latus]
MSSPFIAVPGTQDSRSPQNAQPAAPNPNERHELQAVLEEDEEENRDTASPKPSSPPTNSPESTPPQVGTPPGTSADLNVDPQPGNNGKQIKVLKPPVDLRSPESRPTPSSTEVEHTPISKKPTPPAIHVDAPSTEESEIDE